MAVKGRGGAFGEIVIRQKQHDFKNRESYETGNSSEHPVMR